ncbi:nitrite reductase [Achromatium sp. WMS2]|nr:nitrite reductase [Achromatium sp. WMS2]
MYSKAPVWVHRLLWLAIVIAFLSILIQWVYPMVFESYTGVVNGHLSYANSQSVTAEEFEAIASELTLDYRHQQATGRAVQESNPFAKQVKTNLLENVRSLSKNHPYAHIDYFRKAGIRRYEGPSTCLTCHATMKVTLPNGTVQEINTLDDVVETVHYKFQQSGPVFTTYGFDGRQVNGPGTRHIPVGKIDRACGVPGSFSWTGWADLIESFPGGSPGGDGKPAVLRSEGCGQCHIGGGYHPATEKMMPIGDVPAVAKQGIDCLICHAREYDMNQRYVLADSKGRRWNQDRSLRTAMTVGLPSNRTCLNCHQHNLGGDMEANLPVEAAPNNLGIKNQRLLHEGSKRGSSITVANDVHAAAGMICTDCHTPQGHKIPRGDKGIDLVANDLPGKGVTCEGCHTAAPHLTGPRRAILNGHGARLACETCHIKQLSPDNVVLRDWIHPVWNAAEGIYTYFNLYQSGEVGKGFKFFWFNGNGTFLANALGYNPLGGDYQPLMLNMVRIDDPETLAAINKAAQELKVHYPDLDVAQYVREATDPLSVLTPEMLAKRQRMISERLLPIMQQGQSKIYPLKIFNAIMYEDMSNQGPFGAMILPFDYPSYYKTGDPVLSMRTAIGNPIVRRMYETPFKLYMMDEFMYYFGVEQWSGIYPIDKDGKLRNVEPHWMRQMGTLMINHGVQKQGRDCHECHSANGIMPFEQLGYPPERVQDLRNLPELQVTDSAPHKP